MKTSTFVGSALAAVALIAVCLTLGSAPAQAAPPPQEAIHAELAGAVPSSAFHQAVTTESLAAPKYSALIWAADGGSSIGYCFTSANQTAELQSLTGTQYCYRTCATTACVADCTKDFRPLGITTNVNDAGSGSTAVTQPVYSTGKIQMGQDKCIAAAALDAGNPLLNMFYHTSNPVPAQ